MAAGRSPGYVRVDQRKASGLSQADLAKAIGINVVEFLDHAETIGFAGADFDQIPNRKHTKRGGFRPPINGPRPGRCYPRMSPPCRGGSSIAAGWRLSGARWLHVPPPWTPLPATTSGRQSSPLSVLDYHAEMPAGAPGARAHLSIRHGVERAEPAARFACCAHPITRPVPTRLEDIPLRLAH